MMILMYVLGGLFLLVVAYGVLLFIVFQRSKLPQHCRNCNEKTLNYVGFFSEPCNGESEEDFIPRAYYRCEKCRLNAKLERGEWYDVPAEEVQQAIDSESDS